MIDEKHDFDLDEESGAPGCFEDARAMESLRRSVLEGMGPRYAQGVLYGIGFNQGLLDGLRVARDFDCPDEAAPLLTGSPLAVVFPPVAQQHHEHFGGALSDSIEAELHLDTYPRSETPVCWMSSGYAAGWYTSLLGQPYLVKELNCIACGSESCEFEARTVSGWMEISDPWINELLPYLDFDRMQDNAMEKLDQMEGMFIEGDMMGGFDPMSPAVHVWGNVMVLPYSGRLDSEAALDAILEDLGPGRLQVVVVDVTGAEIDSVEASGLLQLVDTLTSLGLETVLVGLCAQAAQEYLQPSSCIALPLLADDSTEGISLAFQISQPAGTSS